MEHWDHLNTNAIGQFYHVAVDNRKPYRVYGGTQDNGSWGGPSRSLNGRGLSNSDWFIVGGGDGFVCRVDPENPDVVYYESQNGNVVRTNLLTSRSRGLRPRDPQGKPSYRFNWNTPYQLSAHNPQIYYVAGNYVFKSIKRGEDAQVISPEITRNKAWERDGICRVSDQSRRALRWDGTMVIFGLQRTVGRSGRTLVPSLACLDLDG